MKKLFGVGIVAAILLALKKQSKKVNFIDVVDQLTRFSEFDKRNLSDIKYIVVHHTAGSKNDTPETIAKFHVNSRGFRGIGYHIVINWDGEVFLCNRLDRISSHVGGKNKDSIGISCIGNFENYDIEKPQYESLISVLKELKHQFKDIKIVPHQLFSSTACPGKFLMARLFPEGKNSIPNISGNASLKGLEDASKFSNIVEIDRSSPVIVEAISELFYNGNFDDLNAESVADIALLALKSNDKHIKELCLRTYNQLQYYYSNMANFKNYE